MGAPVKNLHRRIDVDFASLDQLDEVGVAGLQQSLDLS
jgi:hypothetical protein